MPERHLARLKLALINMDSNVLVLGRSGPGRPGCWMRIPAICHQRVVYSLAYEHPI
uniref:Uncharacterized protein n=1 Tax=Arundo donax TaxID=35708 RepID=A0A0A9B6M9_ARUDO